MKRLRVFALAIVAVSFAAGTQAAEWGGLKGRIVVDGDVPAPEKITPTKDVETCSKHELVDESIVVDSDGGLANVIVYLYTKRGKSVDVHPDYEESAKSTVELDNKDCRFEPHVALLRTTQTLEIKNSDPVGHNTNCKLLKNSAFNEIIAAGSSTTKDLSREEAIPAEVTCNIHPWMRGYLFVRDNPYMTVSSETGEFEIKNIPAGKHEFGFWHEAPGNLRKIEVGGDETSRRGLAELTIEAGETLDLGDITIPAKALKGR